MRALIIEHSRAGRVYWQALLQANARLTGEILERVTGLSKSLQPVAAAQILALLSHGFSLEQAAAAVNEALRNQDADPVLAAMPEPLPVDQLLAQPFVLSPEQKTRAVRLIEGEGPNGEPVMGYNSVEQMFLKRFIPLLNILAAPAQAAKSNLMFRDLSTIAAAVLGRDYLDLSILSPHDTHVILTGTQAHIAAETSIGIGVMGHTLGENSPLALSTTDRIDCSVEDVLHDFPEWLIGVQQLGQKEILEVYINRQQSDKVRQFSFRHEASSEESSAYTLASVKDREALRRDVFFESLQQLEFKEWSDMPNWMTKLSRDPEGRFGNPVVRDKAQPFIQKVKESAPGSSARIQAVDGLIGALKSLNMRFLPTVPEVITSVHFAEAWLQYIQEAKMPDSHLTIADGYKEGWVDPETVVDFREFYQCYLRMRAKTPENATQRVEGGLTPVRVIKQMIEQSGGLPQ